MGNLEIGLVEIKTDVDNQKAELGALRTEFSRLQSDVEAKLRRSVPEPLIPRTDNEKKAYLGGLPQKTSEAIKKMAEAFTGSPEGLVQVEVLGNVCTGAVVLFTSPELMHKSMKTKHEQAAQGTSLSLIAGPWAKESRNAKS